MEHRLRSSGTDNFDAEENDRSLSSFTAPRQQCRDSPTCLLRFSAVGGKMGDLVCVALSVYPLVARGCGVAVLPLRVVLQCFQG